jgi:hypothetical protein
MLARIPSSELAAWMVYERDYGPLGPERHDHLAALVASTIANANRGKKKRRFKVREFLPVWSKRRQSPAEQLSILRGFTRRLGGEEVHRVDDR